MSYQDRFQHDEVLRNQFGDLLEHMPHFDEKNDYLVLVEDSEGTGFLEIVAGFNEDTRNDAEAFTEIMEIARDRADEYGLTRKGQPYGVALLKDGRHTSYTY